MKNFNARTIWPGSFPDVAKLCFNCFVELVLTESPTATGDDDPGDVTNCCQFFLHGFIIWTLWAYL